MSEMKKMQSNFSPDPAKAARQVQEFERTVQETFKQTEIQIQDLLKRIEALEAGP